MDAASMCNETHLASISRAKFNVVLYALVIPRRNDLWAAAGIFGFDGP
jgi:hypothetical protein